MKTSSKDISAAFDNAIGEYIGEVSAQWNIEKEKSDSIFTKSNKYVARSVSPKMYARFQYEHGNVTMLRVVVGENEVFNSARPVYIQNSELLSGESKERILSNARAAKELFEEAKRKVTSGYDKDLLVSMGVGAVEELVGGTVGKAIDHVGKVSSDAVRYGDWGKVQTLMEAAEPHLVAIKSEVDAYTKESPSGKVPTWTDFALETVLYAWWWKTAMQTTNLNSYLSDNIRHLGYIIEQVSGGEER